MGNCQAAEGSTVLIQHPGGKIERIYWPLSASQIMAANPGHYVAVITTSQTVTPNSSGPPAKHLKLLRPDDTLHTGNNYRLVSFEEVLREFASKKRVRFSKLLNAAREKRRQSQSKRGEEGPVAESGEHSLPPSVHDEEARGGGEAIHGREAAAPPSRAAGQWRPALHSIEEVI